MAVLSIVIPTYNMDAWLATAIESCLYQTHRDVEVLIVNDGSTDGSAAIADRYARLDSRVRHIAQPNGGLGAARQRGQDEASGDYITWLDADDFLPRHAAAAWLKTAQQDAVPLVCGNAIAFSHRTFNARRYFPHPAASRLRFTDAPRYWKSKVVWRWIVDLPFLRTGKEGQPFTHVNYKLSQDVCFMYDVLTRAEAFSQCAEICYCFRQEHKSAHVTLETLVEHELRHFLDVRDILLTARPPYNKPHIKPLIKYLNENAWRDLRQFAARRDLPLPYQEEADRQAEYAARLEDVVSFGIGLFQSLDPAWFTEDFLAPELKPQPDFLPLVNACISGNRDAVKAVLHSLAGVPERNVDKETFFHTLRHHLKALGNPLSWQARCALHTLHKNAAKRQEQA